MFVLNERFFSYHAYRRKSQEIAECVILPDIPALEPSNTMFNLAGHPGSHTLRLNAFSSRCWLSSGLFTRLTHFERVVSWQ